MELVAGCYEQVLFGFAARPAEVTREGGNMRAAAVNGTLTPALKGRGARPGTHQLVSPRWRRGLGGGWAFKARRGRGSLPQPQARPLAAGAAHRHPAAPGRAGGKGPPGAADPWRSGKRGAGEGAVVPARFSPTVSAERRINSCAGDGCHIVSGGGGPEPGGRRVSSLQWWKKGESAYVVHEVSLCADTCSHTASSKPQHRLQEAVCTLKSFGLIS